jgi:NADP-dependent 3-hydroxy acid dehydrogenase YdfG
MIHIFKEEAKDCITVTLTAVGDSVCAVSTSVTIAERNMSKVICRTSCSRKIVNGLQVNSAGILIPGSIETAKLEDYDRQMNTNVRSLLVLTQLAVPHLVKTKGNVVNVSSVAGLRSVSTS